jgi:putative tryptophan/tyrosine transport system substrate-binding protein
MRRREVIALLGGSAATWPLSARGQQPSNFLRVGAVGVQARNGNFVAVVNRMAELGYEEGRNFSFEFVHAANLAGYDAAYRQLADRNVDVLLAFGPEVALRAALATAGTRPIVMVAVDYDPLARGYVRNLARPGGNVTGISFQQIELTEKRLQIVKEAFPDVPAIAVFWDEIPPINGMRRKTQPPSSACGLPGSSSASSRMITSAPSRNCRPSIAAS